ncbi:MAG: hypothetical protein Q9170_003703 [Blastenia crenularia]
MARTKRHITTTTSPHPESPLLRDTFENLVHLIHTRCPQEIVDTIQDYVMESLFCPGYVRLSDHKLPKRLEHAGRSRPRPALLSLSKSIYAEYQPRFWSENTFILSFEGPSNGTARKSIHPFAIAAGPEHIRKVDITFTSDYTSIFRGPYNIRSDENGDPGSWKARNCRWAAWLHFIQLQQQNEVTLDFTPCAGRFDKLAMDDLVRGVGLGFVWPVPKVLEIYAGNEGAEEDTRGTIREMNDGIFKQED